MERRRSAALPPPGPIPSLYAPWDSLSSLGARPGFWLRLPPVQLLRPPELLPGRAAAPDRLEHPAGAPGRFHPRRLRRRPGRLPDGARSLRSADGPDRSSGLRLRPLLSLQPHPPGRAGRDLGHGPAPLPLLVPEKPDPLPPPERFPPHQPILRRAPAHPQHHGPRRHAAAHSVCLFPMVYLSQQKHPINNVPQPPRLSAPLRRRVVVGIGIGRFLLGAGLLREGIRPDPPTLRPRQLGLSKQFRQPEPGIGRAPVGRPTPHQPGYAAQPGLAPADPGAARGPGIVDQHGRHKPSLVPPKERARTPIRPDIGR